MTQINTYTVLRRIDRTGMRLTEIKLVWCVLEIDIR